MKELGMNEPTQEEIKRFWEHWGFKEILGKERWRYEKFKETNHWWEAPSGRKYKELPPIDLKNLFKYAVPKAIQKMMGELTYDRRSAVKALFKKWLDNNPNGIEDPAYALFWAIYKVI